MFSSERRQTMKTILRVWIPITISTLLVLALLLLLPQSSQAAGTWYVQPDGDDGNSCLSPGVSEACATITGALGKATSGDTILVATGVYTSTSSQVVLIDKNISLSGGWDTGFSAQGGASVIDGEGSRRSILVNNNVTSTIDHFVIERGIASGGGGIYDNGTLTLDHCSIISNTASSEGGGVFIQSTGTLNLNLTEVGNNQANSGGGIFSYRGILNINNSTLHNNFANGGGGINNLGGNVSLNSSTISGNESGTMSGGGIRNEDEGTVILKNTIIARNSGDFGPDCNGEFTSLGYNLIGDNSECTFGSSTGDLMNMDPGLYHKTVGAPAYFPLQFYSPAIDAGNPDGCKDDQGNLLDTDQRGVARVGQCDIGSYEYDPDNDPINYIYLPCVMRPCTNFFDNFSNPNSGWYVGDGDYLKVEYVNGEYRMLSKQDGYVYSVSSPSCARENYSVEVDAHWSSSSGNLYGIIFGLIGNFDSYYLFGVNSDYQYYRLDRWHNGGWTEIIPWKASSAIDAGFSTNHLMITRVGDQISLKVNGTNLESVTEGSLTGLTFTGLTISPYDDYPTADARFDNFSTVTLAGSGSSTSSENQLQTFFSDSRQRFHIVPYNVDR
jgi:hypothetical protein